MATQEPLVVSNIGLVLEAFVNKVQEFEPLAKYVYDEQLSYISGMSKFRADNLAWGREYADPFPLFIFNRSQLRHTPDGASRRHTVGPSAKLLDGGQAQAYKFIHGEIDIPFLFCAIEATRIEDFEISYLSQDSFATAAGRELKVCMPELGEYIYYAKYSGVLDQKVFESQGVYYKALSSTVTIRGFYFVVKGTGPVITEIHSKVQNFRGAVLMSDTITPT